MIMFIKQKRQKGFTLIEMLVAVSIFIIVAFIVTTVFISAMDAYRKSQEIKRVMENLNFALDSMALDIREGKGHTLIGSSELSVEFKDANDTVVTNIYKVSDERIQKTSNGSQTFLTSEEIRIKKLVFVIPNQSAGRKLIRALIQGETGNVVKGISAFSVQTTLFQRNSDDN